MVPHRSGGPQSTIADPHAGVRHCKVPPTAATCLKISLPALAESNRSVDRKARSQDFR